MHMFNKGHLQSLSCLLPKCLAPSLFFTSLQFLHTVKLNTNMINSFYIMGQVQPSLMLNRLDQRNSPFCQPNYTLTNHCEKNKFLL